MKTNKTLLTTLIATSLMAPIATATTVTDNDINVGQGNVNNASYTMSVVSTILSIPVILSQLAKATTLTLKGPELAVIKTP